MEKSKQFPIQGFLLSISYQNSIISLEAEEKSSGKIFIANLDSDAVAQITNRLFNNAEDLAQSLEDAAEGSCSDLKLAIDTQGKMTYTMIFSAGKIKREDSFVINFVEKELNSDESLSQMFNVISRWKEEHGPKMNHIEETLYEFQGKSEERFNNLEDLILQMQKNITQRIDAREKSNEAPKVLQIQKGESTISSGHFNTLSVNASEYSFDNNNLTIKLLFSSHPGLELFPEIGKPGIYSYSFKIISERSGYGDCVGITTKISKGNWNANECNYRYWTSSGLICGINIRQDYPTKGPFGGAGRILKMVVDMDKGILSIFVDNQEVNSCQISTSETYYAYVGLGHVGNSITLL